MPLNLGDIVVRLGLDTGQFSREMRAAQRQLQGAASGFKTAGRTATMAFTAPLVAAGALAVKFAADFDAAMTQSMAIMSEFGSRSELAAEGQESLRGEMEATARTVAKELNLAATDAAKSYFFLTSAGMDAQQSMAALPQVAAFAKAGMFDFATATDLATDAQSALGLKSTDVAENLAGLTRVTDVLVRANQLANASVEQFSTSLTTKAGAALKVANKDIEEGVAVLAAFADQGVKSQDAGTALNIVLRDLSTKAIKNKEAFDSLGVAVFDSSGNYNNMADIIGDLEGALEGMSDSQKKATLLQLGFTDKSVIFLQTLLGTSDAIREYETELRKAGGTAKEVAESQLKAFNEQLGLVQKRVVDAAISLGTALMPMVLDLMDALEPLLGVLIDAVEWFAALPKPVQMAATAAAAMAAAIGPLLMAIGFVAEGVAALIAIWPMLTAAMSFVTATAIPAIIAGFQAMAVYITGTLVPAIVSVATTLGSMLLPALAAVATAIAAYKLTEWAVEWLGLRDVLDQYFKVLVQVVGITDQIPKSAQQMDILARASALMGEEITDWSEAMRIVNDETMKARERMERYNKKMAESARATEDLAQATEGGQDALDMFADAMGISRKRLDLVAKRLGLTTKKLFDNAKASGMVRKELDKMAKEAADAEKRLRDMVRTVGDATREAEDMARAVELEGGAMALTKEETKRLAAMIEVWEGNNIDVARSLEDVVARAEALKLVENVLNKEMEITSVRGDKVVSTLEEMAEAHRKKLEQLKLDNEAMEAYNIYLEAQAAATEVAGVTAEEFTAALGTVGDVAWELAAIFDGAFGRIANSMGIAVDAGRRLKSSLEGADWARAAGSLVEGAMALAQATEGGGMGGVAGGAISGAVMGAQIGGGYGAAIGGAIGALVGWLREDVGQAIQSVLGRAVSEGLEASIKQTKDMFKDFEDATGRAGAEGIGTRGAALLHLGNAMREYGGATAYGMEQTRESLGHLIDWTNRGALPMEQGIAAIGDAFTQFAAAATEGGAVATRGLFEIMKQVRESGMEIPEITAFIEEQLGQAMEGIGAIIGTALGEGEGFGGIQIVSAQDAQDQATIFSSTFFAAVEELGLRAATEAMGPAFDAMREKMAAFGDVDFGGVEKFFEIARDPQFGPLLDGVQGLADSVAGLTNSGYMTVDAFNALQRQGLDAFDQLKAAGLTSEEALQQMAPYLQNAIDASNQLGIPLDANTAKLIDQAEAAGVAFSSDPMYVMIDAIKVLAEIMGGTTEQIASIGSTATESADQVSSIGESAKSSADQVAAIGDSAASSASAVTDLGAKTSEAGEIVVELGNRSSEVEERFMEMGQGAKGGLELVASTAGEVSDEVLSIGDAAMDTEGQFTEMGKAAEGDLELVVSIAGEASDEVLSIGDAAASNARGFDRMAAAARGAGAAIGDMPRPPRGRNPEPMQHGALVTSPTVALIGEAGPELVIPVGDLNQAVGNAADLGDGDRGGDAPLANYVTIVLDGQVVEKLIVKTVARAHRLGDIDFTEQLVDPRA